MKKTLFQIKSTQAVQKISTLMDFLHEGQRLFDDMPEVKKAIEETEHEIQRRPEMGIMALQSRIGDAFLGDISAEELESNISFLSGRFSISDMIQVSSDRVFLFAKMLKSILKRAHFNLFRVIKIVRILIQEKRLMIKLSMFSLSKFRLHTQGIAHTLLQFLWPNDLLKERENASTAREIMAQVYYEKKTASPPFFTLG